MKSMFIMLFVFAVALPVSMPSPAQACEECYFVDIGLGGEPRATCLDLVPGGWVVCFAFGGLAGEGCALSYCCFRDFPLA